jgi:mRNA interferase MazF
MISIRKGDIVKIDFPFSDGIGTKPRPALVISNEEIHKTGDVLVVQISSKEKSDSLSLPINDGDLTIALPLRSYIRIYKIFVVESEMISDVLSSLSPEKYREVTERITQLIK